MYILKTKTKYNLYAIEYIIENNYYNIIYKI